MPRVSFLSESPTPNGIPKHLDIMVYKVIGLRADVFQYHLSLHGKLEQADKVIYRFIGFIYSLYLFIDFICSIWWLYLLDLSIGFSFSVHSIHSHSNLTQIFSQLRKELLFLLLLFLLFSKKKVFSKSYLQK